MTDGDRFTVQEHEQNVASLAGRRLAEIRYYPVGLVDGPGIEDWDFDGWHLPTMGIELRDEQDAVFTTVWSVSSRIEYSLELHAGPIDDLLVRDARQPVDVTSHTRWAPFIGVPLETSSAWSERDGPDSVPVALRLSAGSDVLWIAAACPTSWPPCEEFSLGSDDVMVIFDERLAVAQQLERMQRSGRQKPAAAN